MDIKLIKKIISLAKEENVASLKVESDDVKISVSLVGGAPVVQAPAPVATPAVTSSVQPGAQTIADSGLHEIKSPFVGTFYRSSSPTDPPFIKQGDKISPGQTLCILEAMKIMNEIDADISGEVVEICVENESLVEFGQVLFRVRK